MGFFVGSPCEASWELGFAFCLCGVYRMGHRSSGIVQRKLGAGPYAFDQRVHPCGTRT